MCLFFSLFFLYITTPIVPPASSRKKAAPVWPQMDVLWVGSMASGMGPPGTGGYGIGMGVLPGLCRKRPPLGALCLHCMEEGMVELPRGSGSAVPGPGASVLPTPWACSGRKVLTDRPVPAKSRPASRAAWPGCMPPMSRAEISIDGPGICLCTMSSSMRLFMRRCTCSRFTSLSWRG